MTKRPAGALIGLADRGHNTQDEIKAASRALADDVFRSELSVPDIHCANCIRAIEKGLGAVEGVTHVRVNLSTRRAAVTWQGSVAPDLLAALDALGFAGHLTDSPAASKDPQLAALIKSLAIAGFCAINIMMLSVSIWAGADAGTRHAFHWISAALALVCLAFSGRIFFKSAWTAIRHCRTNMDVPISIGVILAFSLSLYDTIDGGRHAYFDAATSLLFFLLVGRTLDHMMRQRARTAVQGLERLAPRVVSILHDDGTISRIPLDAVETGMRISVAAGERIPVDGLVCGGQSDLDCALVTGESAPRPVSGGAAVQAGMLNITGPLTITASTRAEDSFLAEMVRMMEAAENGRAGYRRLADRMSAYYAPVVHTAALLTFAGWMFASSDLHMAITVAVTVLIITCPCALGLAVPIVQVVAAKRLFESGIMVKDGAAIERMAEIDAAIFDKTGTLTLGKPRLVASGAISPRDMEIAIAMAGRSSHPLSRAIADTGHGVDLSAADIAEHPGLGMEWRSEGTVYRLGRPVWALDAGLEAPTGGVAFTANGHLRGHFTFEDKLRPQARSAIDALRLSGIDLRILSGDEAGAVGRVARSLDIAKWEAGLMPGEKVARLKAMTLEGRKTLMVGDGLNDAPALGAAYVSMAPASAADIGRSAADFVFLRDSLDAVPAALYIARASRTLIRQNFGLALAYNALALPIAVSGYVTPLVAALAMSTSSILVVANALRLKAPTALAHGSPQNDRRIGLAQAPEPAE